MTHLSLDYKYEYCDHYYGFSKAQLNQCIDHFDNVFAIIRNIQLMGELKEDYRDYKVIAVYIHSDLRLIEERLQRQGRTQSQIDFRLSRISETFADYVSHSDFFDEVIVNTSDKVAYYTLIDNLIKKYSRAVRQHEN